MTTTKTGGAKSSPDKKSKEALLRGDCNGSEKDENKERTGKKRKRKIKRIRMRRRGIMPPPPPVLVYELRQLLTRERCLGAVIAVRDSIIGTGPIANPGRRASISYVGTLLSDGTIFDENTGDSEGGKVKDVNGGPLTFRADTGRSLKVWREVWRGCGGGGERIITMPLEIGYRREGSK